MNSNELNNLVQNPQKIRSLDFSILSEILKRTKKILESEDILMEFKVVESEEIFVIGDIHGNLETLNNVFKLIAINKPKYIIFLGDIVDRGPYQLECLVSVLVHKILNPRKFYILKGNHETLEMNQYYGFFTEFMNIYQNRDYFSEILEVYNTLPFCSTINDNILSVHGGIPENLDILNEIRGIKTRNLVNQLTTSLSKSLYQMIWNDPKDVLNLRYSESFRGPGIKFFGEIAFENFIGYNNLNYVIRAHECFPEGYRWFFNKRLLSIFTSENYRGEFFPNPASFAVVKSDKIIAKLL